MKTIITLLYIACSLWVFGETADSMLIHKTDGSVLTIALADIDSTTFKQTEIIVNSGNWASSVSALPGIESEHFYEVDALSKDVAYVVSTKNKLYKTQDGGQSWTDVTPPNTDGLTLNGAVPQVSFYNAQIGAVAFSVDDGTNGYNSSITYGYVWCTTDGGQTWSSPFSVSEDQILHLEQVNETVVYVSGTSAWGVASNRWFKKIVRTESTGAYTLSSLALPPYSLPHTVAGSWYNANVGVMLYKNNEHYLTEPYMTTNGGSSWVRINGNLPNVTAPYYSVCGRSIKVIDDNSFAYVATFNGGTPVKFWRTDDEGSTWVEGSFDDTPTGRLTAVDFWDDQHGVVAGYDSVNYCYITSDGGANWVKEDVNQKTSLQQIICVDCAPDGSLWLCGTYQGLWRKE